LWSKLANLMWWPAILEYIAMSADELAACVGTEAAKEMASARDRIKHCLSQLGEDQVWWRSEPAMNSIGNLILHLCGNVRQWIVSGIGGAKDVRNRPSEFAELGPLPKAELLHRLDAVVGDATATLERLSADQSTALRRIQGSEITGLAAIFNSVPHFRGHTQEIIHISRALLGARYRFAWAPSSAEEGAPT
jgi:hypothetical protein